MKRVKLAGFGGQGLILAGTILGKAALLEGQEVLQGQSYGPAARGGACESNVILSREPIYELSFAGEKFDGMACLSQLAFDRYAGSLRPRGLLFLDETFVRDLHGLPEEAEVFHLPFSRIAEQELGRPAVANMILLGCLIRKTPLVRLDSLRQAMLASIPPGTEEVNLKALERGYGL